jgi:hypothetical protein
MNSSEYSQLADKFSDATPGSDPLTSCKGYLANSASGMPQAARDTVRIYQRYIYIDN